MRLFILGLFLLATSVASAKRSPLVRVTVNYRRSTPQFAEVQSSGPQARTLVDRLMKYADRFVRENLSPQAIHTDRVGNFYYLTFDDWDEAKKQMIAEDCQQLLGDSPYEVEIRAFANWE